MALVAADCRCRGRYRLAASVTDGHPSRPSRAPGRRSDRPEQENDFSVSIFTASKIKRNLIMHFTASKITRNLILHFYSARKR